MDHDPFDLSRLPSEVLDEANRVLVSVQGMPSSLAGPSELLGWVIEPHTAGWLAEGGVPTHLRPAYLLADFDALTADGYSFLLGTPEHGAFVRIFRKASDISLGQVREKTRVPLEQGRRIADAVSGDIDPLAQAVILVGSIRRRRPQVGDVEFVVLPKNLKAFDKAVRDMGFAGGPKMRIYKRSMEGIPVELYIAHEPEEMGGMTLMYTGDWKLNMAMRAKAKRMGYKLDQYGIWKDDRLVFQSPDEKEFFDFIGMEWHAPEERSLATREELRAMARKLRAVEGELSEDERTFLKERASPTLKTRTPLEPEDEARLRALYRDKYAEADTEAGRGASMGAEELIELGRDEKAPQWLLDLWQPTYEKATGRQGLVRDVLATFQPLSDEPDRTLYRIWVEVENEGFYLAWEDHGPARDAVSFQANLDQWLGQMVVTVDYLFGQGYIPPWTSYAEPF